MSILFRYQPHLIPKHEVSVKHCSPPSKTFVLIMLQFSCDKRIVIGELYILQQAGKIHGVGRQRRRVPEFGGASVWQTGQIPVVPSLSEFAPTAGREIAPRSEPGAAVCRGQFTSHDHCLTLRIFRGIRARIFPPRIC